MTGTFSKRMFLKVSGAVAVSPAATHALAPRAGAVAIIMAFASVVAAVQETTAAPPPEQDVAAGRTIVMQGAPGAAACFTCHGTNAEGNAQAGYPRLAGLGRAYIEHQLNSYADGTRANPVMTPVAGALSPRQRAQVAAYLAGLGNAAPESMAASEASVPVLVTRGDERRGIQSCASCHGPQGVGDAAVNPYLAGQNASYLATSLAQWKNGTRHNDPSGKMPAIAKALTDAEVKAIATYYAALPAPAVGNAQAAVVGANAARPASAASGPASAPAPASSGNR